MSISVEHKQKLDGWVARKGERFSEAELAEASDFLLKLGTEGHIEDVDAFMCKLSHSELQDRLLDCIRGTPLRDILLELLAKRRKERVG